MPRPPHPAPQVLDMPGAVFSRLSQRLREHTGPLYPLHIGDSWMEPPEGAHMSDLRAEELPGLHRYGDPQGMPALVDALMEKVRDQNGLPVERGGLLVSGGATGCLGAAIGMLAAPGEEVLILAPFWPLIRGIVQSYRATPVEVPFYDRVRSPDDARAALEAALTPRTVALYVSTPNNPTGQVLDAAILQAIAELARRYDLWLLSDEVYEDYVFRGRHRSIGVWAPERTFTAFSFSKSYAMAGNRVGYLVGPPDAIAQCRKVSTHTVFAAPTAGQHAALRALRGGGPWITRARASYQSAGDAAARVLGLAPPEGSTFLFLDLTPQLDARGVFGFLEDALDDGLLLAPGPSFGQDYSAWARLCFTSAPPDRVAEACHRLARRLGRAPDPSPGPAVVYDGSPERAP